MAFAGGHVCRKAAQILPAWRQRGGCAQDRTLGSDQDKRSQVSMHASVNYGLTGFATLQSCKQTLLLSFGHLG